MIDMTGIDQLPSGKWRFRLQVKGKPIAGTYPTLETCVRERDACKREIADGLMVLVDDVSIERLGPSFLRSRKGNRGIVTERQRWYSHVVTATFAKRAVGSIVRRDVLEWLDDLSEKMTAHKWGKRKAKPLSWQSRKHCLNLLRSFFSWAQDREHVIANPAIGVTVTREDGDEDDGYQEEWYLSLEEQAALLEKCDPVERHIVAFAIGTGLRQGEQWCLHLKDVVVDGPKPHIIVRYGSWDAKNERYLSPKGRKGEKRKREVPLFGLALEAARAWLALLPSYVGKHGNPLGLMFPTARGARRGKSKAPKTFAATVKAFGKVPRIGKTAWWHLLRHTCASSLVAGWWGKRWSFEDVRAFLGHSSVKVTERYAHLAISVVHDVATAAEAAWQNRCHGVVTTGKKGGKKPAGTVLRSRMSQVRLLPGVPNDPAQIAEPGRASHDNAVTTAHRLLEAVAEGSPHALRIAVDLASTVLRNAERGAAAERARGRR